MFSVINAHLLGSGIPEFVAFKQEIVFVDAASGIGGSRLKLQEICH